MSAPRDNCQCRIIPVAKRSGSVPPFPYSIKRDAVTVEYCPMHAAAPELLESLQTMTALAHVYVGDDPKGLALVAKATAAIFKAEERL